MSKIYFVLLVTLILSLPNCDARNIRYKDGSHSDDVESLPGHFSKKTRLLRNINAPTGPAEKSKFNFDNDLVTMDERKSAGINGSFIGEASSRASSCAVASVPCSCASAKGKCSCTSTACTCTVDPCVLNGSTSTGSSSSSSGSSSSSSSSSGSGSSGSSSSSSSSQTSSSGTKTSTTTCVNCDCETVVCTNNVCDPPVASTLSPCPG